MLTIIKHKDLGHANHGWLHARHHFSFANYYNPSRMSFGHIRVINDDSIKAGYGFDTHPHKNMEIITYVRKGAITHKDSKGNQGRTVAGDVQVMSAGTGIFHSEHNKESEDTLLYQIWIEPNKKDIDPRWEQANFPKMPITKSLPILVSGTEGEGLFINQDMRIYGGKLVAGTTINQDISGQAYILISEGSLTINGEKVEQGDGIEVTELSKLSITAIVTAEILIIT